MKISTNLNLTRHTQSPTMSNHIIINQGSSDSNDTKLTVDESKKDERNRIQIPMKRNITKLGIPSNTSTSSSSEEQTLQDSYNLRESEVDIAIDKRIKAFEHRFLELCIAILTNEYQFLDKIINRKSNEIILRKQDLIELISILTDSNSVIIEDEPDSSGCCSALFNPCDNITKILVDERDFFICENEFFNVLCKYRISLTKTFEPM